MKRLITFGCSFTDYSWPTWADIIADDLGCEYENWAMGGGGNQQIARRALYRYTRGFDATDIVMIQWTSITREDRWLNNRWLCEGSVAMSPTYQGNFMEKYWSWDNDVINTAHSRITTEQLLKPWLKYQMAMTWTDGDANLFTDNPKISEYWQRHLPQVDELPYATNTLNGKTADGHPDPQWWLQWVETRIYPRFNLTLKDRTRQRVKELQDYLQNLANKGTPHRELQHLATIRANKSGWRLMKVKPHSDTLSPGLGSDILM